MHIHLKYPFAWAEGVVDTYFEDHARASDIVVEITGVSRKEIAWLLARGSPSWEGFKRLVKVATAYQESQDRSGVVVPHRVLRSALEAHCERTGLLNRRIVLTRARKRAHSEEHDSNGAVDAATAAETAHLLEAGCGELVAHNRKAPSLGSATI